LVLTGALALGSGVWEETFSVPDPAMAFLGELRRALGVAGIVVEGDLDVWGWATHGGRLPEEGGLRELGWVESATAAQMVGVMLGVSQNQYAQMLLMMAGAELEGLGEAGGLKWTADLGLERMGRFLARAGISAGEYRMDEGAGLARSDRVTPAALVRLLRYMERHPERGAFVAGLPVTVIHTAESELEVRAKSGTMSDIYALAGYAKPYGGRVLAFSVMLNGFRPGESAEGRRVVLESVRLAAKLAGERGEQGEDAGD
jgi:D-alanyl-D-alanine carboxypeptidase/D-alanyl-D-alanine-endopeptidase (penicillin-binding protein 4)